MRSSRLSLDSWWYQSHPILCETSKKWATHKTNNSKNRYLMMFDMLQKVKIVLKSNILRGVVLTGTEISPTSNVGQTVNIMYEYVFLGI